MNRRLLFLPFAGFVALSGYLGWQMGQPLSESDVLEFYAAEWVDTGPAGAVTTDCFGTPSDRADVWIIVTCTRGDTLRETSVSPSGRSIASQEGPQA